MKKSISLVLAIIVLLGITSVYTQKADAADIMPRYNNADYATTGLTISSSGLATIDLDCGGGYSVVTRITAETKLERKWGIFWLDVDGGEWTDTTTNRMLSKTHTLQLTKTGTYRVTVKYTVSGTGGANDVIETTVTDDYT